MKINLLPQGPNSTEARCHQVNGVRISHLSIVRKGLYMRIPIHSRTSFLFLDRTDRDLRLYIFPSLNVYDCIQQSQKFQVFFVFFKKILVCRWKKQRFRLFIKLFSALKSWKKSSFCQCIPVFEPSKYFSPPKIVLFQDFLAFTQPEKLERGRLKIATSAPRTKTRLYNSSPYGLSFP